MTKYLISLTVSFSLMLIGAVLTVSEVLDFTVKGDFNNQSLTKKALVYEITKTTQLMDISTDNTKTPTVVYDDNITAGNVKIIVSYYNTFIDITKDSTFLDNREVVYIEADGIAHFNNIKKFIDISIDGLKRKEVYNYEKALLPDVQVIINSADKDVVKIRK